MEAMANEPRLSFSANGSGVKLHTRHGSLNFNSEEFSYYQSLFKIADNCNLGKLLMSGSQLNLLLVRADIEWNVVEKAMKVIQFKDDHEEPGFQFNQWLMLCKLLACFQETKKMPSEKVFKQLHTRIVRIPLAEFNLTQAKSTFTAGQLMKEFKSEVSGWQLYGDEHQQHHVKFKISSTAQLVNTTDAKITAEQERTNVQRRYSDFESLVHILHRNYPGSVVPPLPLKNWAPFLSATDESRLAQRQIELQMFLDDLVLHPVLRCSYELKAFLESSSAGFKAFVELYSHVAADGSVDYSGLRDMHSSRVSRLISDGASVVSGAGQVVTQTKAFGYLSSLWGLVAKSVFAAPAAAESPEDAALVSHCSELLQAVVKIGDKAELLLRLESANSEELFKLSENFKNVSYLPSSPTALL